MRNRITLGITVAVLTALLPVQLAGAQGQQPHQHDDHAAKVADNGLTYYVDPAPQAPEATPQRNPRAGAAAALYPVSQTFKLHSLASSNRKIYLDFNGYNLPSNSAWVTNSTMSAQAVTGFSLDGSASFNAAEHTQIQEIWRIVAEKYSPFNVDVTTQDPGAVALARNGSGDQNYGVRAVITNDPDPANQICGGGCGGVAWAGTFNFVDQQVQRDPAWVFAQNAFANALTTAHGVAHEVGHTLGLAHDGTNPPGGDNYYFGHGNWVPIMGIGRSDLAIGQWSKGEYANANNTQDDLTIIANTGAPRRGDDVGNTTATAKLLPTDSPYRRSGVIGTSADVDVFRVNRACTAPLTATANTIGKGTSLDLSLEILDSTGAVLGSANPPSGQNMVGDTALPTGVNASKALGSKAPGTYYVRLAGVGSGNPLTNGYTDYGSIGQYSLTVSGCPAKKPTAAKIGKASSGAKGGAKKATARWSAPSSTGGSPITGYKVVAYKLNAKGKVVKTRFSSLRSASSRSYTWSLPAGRYKFKVVAYNKIGAAPGSGFSKIVRSR